MNTNWVELRVEFLWMSNYHILSISVQSKMVECSLKPNQFGLELWSLTSMVHDCMLPLLSSLVPRDILNGNRRYLNKVEFESAGHLWNLLSNYCFWWRWQEICLVWRRRRREEEDLWSAELPVMGWVNPNLSPFFCIKWRVTYTAPCVCVRKRESDLVSLSLILLDLSYLGQNRTIELKLTMPRVRCPYFIVSGERILSHFHFLTFILKILTAKYWL